MQTDGTLVIYMADGVAVWHSQTSGQGPSKAALQADGSLVITNAAGTMTWSSPGVQAEPGQRPAVTRSARGV